MNDGMKEQLGRLERVNLHDYWASEAADFTPWLAQPENLRIMGDTIGLELVTNAQEKYVGPYRADILCQDTTTGHFVVIENQLERTDHSHLGQLLTYAAGLDAVTIIWVAARFTDEHRAAIDWLNRVSADGINFFGLEIELWRIGASAPAPRFNIASQPNDWIEQSRAAASASQLSPTAQRQVEFWSDFREYMLSRNSSVRVGRPVFPSEIVVALGRANFALVVLATTNHESIRLKLVITGPDGKPHFHLLHARSSELATLGKLEWLENPDRVESHVIHRISVRWDDSPEEVFPVLAEVLER